MEKKDYKPAKGSYRKPEWPQESPRPSGELKFYDNQDMLQIFNICARTLQRWRDEGLVPYKKIRGRYYYIPADIEAMMRDQ